MNSAIERLLSLRATHVMQSKVVTVPAEATMGAAAEEFCRFKISGAPVVAKEGQCVGVLSAVDFVRRELKCPSHSSTNHRSDEPVRAYMTPTVHSIGPNASLMDAAREMCNKHVHRLPVLDLRGNVTGVISSLDIVAAMVHAIEE